MNEHMDQYMDDAAALPMGEASPFSGAAPDWVSAEEIPTTPPPEVAAADKPIPDPTPEPTHAPNIVRESNNDYAGSANDAHVGQPSGTEHEESAAAENNGHTEPPTPAPQAPPQTVRRQPQHLTISFRRSGDINRDTFRLKELYERVRDPRGRDVFHIRLESKGRPVTLDFPNDACTVSERLTGDLARHFRVEYTLGEA